jgi:hypothetical protein
MTKLPFDHGREIVDAYLTPTGGLQGGINEAGCLPSDTRVV